MADITVSSTVPAAGPDTKTAPPRTARATEGAPADRTIQDVITLSSGGEKVFNVARGLELAKEFRQGGPDQAKALRLAVDDVFRITRQFTQSVNAGFKAVFAFFRR